ncbi:MAG: CHASE3 domain-containing protein [Chitinophagaceae bacterium]|nr:CHASE3 domain-containing protein [Chitinophagaceae bacterium]
MKNRFLYIALGLSLLLLVWLGSIFLRQNRLQLRYTSEVERTYRVIIALRNCEQYLSNAETSQRGFLLTRNEHFREPYRVALFRADSSLSALGNLIADNATQRVNLKLLETAFRQREDMLNTNLATQKHDAAFIKRMEDGELIMDKIKVYVEQMEKVEYDLLQYRNREKDHYQDLNQAFLKYASLFAGLVFLCSVALLIRELRIRVRTQKMLEKTVFELKQSNEEIEQVSFAASHDLQEPLRKIRTLSTLLTTKFSDKLPSDEKDIVARIDRSTERMHGLLENLIDFTNLVSHPEKLSPVELEQVFAQAFDQVLARMDVQLDKRAELPRIMGYEQQLCLLFTQLLTNSLKFRHRDRQLVLSVSYELRNETPERKWFWQRAPKQQYHLLTLRDNGIGFDSMFNEKIFLMFQRLHNQVDYAGQGIGLTIARRIMTNHYGYIEAEGVKDKGAVFKLWFPVS